MAEHNLTVEDNASRDDQNGTKRSDYPIANNWFFYRDFLTGMETVYKYGTNAVIVVGSGIDNYLYQLLSSDANSTKQVKGDTASARDENTSALSEKIQPIESSTGTKQSVPSQKEKAALPRQLVSQDKNKGEQTYLLSESFAEKTVNTDFLDRTNNSYIRLRGGYAYDYRGTGNYIYSIDARLRIPRTQRKYHLIVGDDTKNSEDLSVKGTNAELDNSIALGVNNLFGLFYPIESKIHFGFSGATNPYGKVAFSYEALLGTWLMVPSQTFRYSRKDEFNEWTNLEFRRRITDSIMFSQLFQRSTITGTEGSDYFMQPSVSFEMGKYGNLTTYLGVYGRTKEQPENEDGYTPKKGIYRYAFGINWNKKSSRKYIVYRVQPVLSYDDEYAFKQNYTVQALLEFYFGLRN
ncbi:hypothetical protein KKE54_07890 [bacterium]|nr:hypothetical protein [bacterium]